MVVNAGITWLENMVAKGKSNNLFLWLDSFDPHEPWDPPDSYTNMYAVPEYDGLPITWGGGFAKDWTLAEIRHLRSQYAGTITLVDRWTGIFLEKVEELGLLDNTMIIFLSDHGEPLGEHGIIKKIQPWPYDELSRIPLIVKLPDVIDSQERVDAFVGLPDIAPTILSFLEIRTPPVMQGMDLLPLIKGEEPGASFGISGFHSRAWSIRDHERSYYLWLKTRLAAGVAKEPELYKYDTHYVPPPPAEYVLGDQAEKKNLFAEGFDVADRLETELRTFVEALSPSPGDLMASEFMKRKIVPRR
jgi:arylsulfatase A-like enzyme